MLRDKIYLVFFVIIFYKLFLKRKENMSNTQNNIREIVNEVYKADVEAIRNLSDIADKLQGKGKYKNKEIVLPGNLTIRGNLNIDRDLKVNKNSNVKGQTTINQLYGGINGWKNWRTIKVNGGNLSFDIGKNKYAFNDNTGGIHFARSNKYGQLPIYYGANVQGQVNAKNVYVNDKIDTRRMDVRNDKGKMRTHFNYSNKGENYIRGNLYHQQGEIKGKKGKHWVNFLKKGDRVYLRSYGGWRSKTGSYKNKHHGIHFNSKGYAVAWSGGNQFR